MTGPGLAEIIAGAGGGGREVVPCCWQRGGPIGLANDGANDGILTRLSMSPVRPTVATTAITSM